MQHWSDTELRAAVDAYYWMLEQQAIGNAFVKVEVYRDLKRRYGRSEGAWEYRMQNISALLASRGESTVAGLLPAKHVGARTSEKLLSMLPNQHSDPSPKLYKYGLQRTWEIVLSAVLKLGGDVTVAQVRHQVQRNYPTFNLNNVPADLYLLTVNAPARTSYPANHESRRSDGGSPYDRLYKSKRGQQVIYQLYQPAMHGVWEIFADASGPSTSGYAIRQIEAPAQFQRSQAELKTTERDEFWPDSVIDERDRVYASIMRRQGQPAFRRDLLAAYDGSCAITGCDVVEVLEAAHVYPYRGEATHRVVNGLLLRADIHTLFDLYLVSIDPDTRKICIAPQLREGAYAELHGTPLRQPVLHEHAPSRSALHWHRSQCSW